MNRTTIENLVEKYFDGETSIDEERQLKQYFSQKEIDPELEKLRPLFLFLKKEKTVEMPLNKAVPLRPLTAQKGGAWRRFRAIAAAAATFTVIAAGAFLYQKNMETARAIAAEQAALEKLNHDTFDDPEQARAEIQKALALVSRKMNKGKKEAAKGLQKVDKLHIFKNK